MKDKPVIVELFWEQCIGRFIDASANTGSPPLADVFRIVRDGHERCLSNKDIFLLLNRIGKEEEPWIGNCSSASSPPSESASR